MRDFLQVEHRAKEIPDEPFVFLGGTCNGSTWRQKLIPQLNIAYYDPVVEQWTPADRDQEEVAKERASILVYMLSPKQDGRYNFVEAAVSAMKVTFRKGNQRVIIIMPDEDDDRITTEAQKKSNAAIRQLLEEESVIEIYTNLEEVARAINSAIV